MLRHVARLGVVLAVLAAGVSTGRADDTLNALFFAPMTDIATFTPGVGNTAAVAGNPPAGASGQNCCGGTGGNLSAGISVGNTWTTRSAFRFPDVATLGDTEIVSATLRIFRNSRLANASTQLTRLNAPFTTTISGTSSGNAVPNGQLWSGCCTGDLDNALFMQLVNSGTPIATIPTSPASGYIDIDVTSVVQSWQASNYTNAFGFGLRSLTDTAGNSQDVFAGALSANPPLLLVEFVVPLAPEPGSVVLWALMGGAVAATLYRRSRALRRG